MNRFSKAMSALAVAMATCVFPAKADHSIDPEQVIFGAGPSTVIVSEFFDRFQGAPGADGFTFSVPPESVKHAGGIRASKQYLFGRTGRPLSKSERDEGKTDLFLGRVPTGFVVGKQVQVSSLTLDQLQAILRKDITNWSQLGGPDAMIVVAGREKTEAVLTAMAPDIPALLEADFDWQFKRDHNLVNFISSPAGVHAIGFGALSNFKGLDVVNIKDNTFGVPLGLVVDNTHLNHPVVKAVQEFAASDEWRNALPKLGFHPYP